METTRQNKISRLIQKELSEIFLLQTKSMNGVLVSVSAVRISPDMSIARVYLSVFPSERSQEIVKNINDNMKSIRYELGTRVRHQLRIIPELKFFVDDSLDYAERIDELLKKQNRTVNFPFYIAKRYLFSKKSHNAINVISAISVCGVALATLALVCTLSVFNGFQDLVATFFTAFDPELKITAVTGKVFDGQEVRIEALRRMPEIAVFSESLEENAMVQYKDRQTMAVIKGIEDNFEDLTAIDSILFGRGQFVLHDEVVDYAIPGIELVSILGTGIKFLDPLEIYAPKRGVKVNMANPASSFNSADLYSSGLVFAVNQQKYDSSYILTSLQFARRLFQYDTEVSSVELKLKPDVDAGSVKSKIQKILGDDFRVQDRYEQQADTFRIMEIEKLISYIFLTFILMIACFNVIGSLSMLIIDKKADVVTLRNLGASDKLITRIFLFEGRMISLMGAVIGVALGLILCFIQQEFGLLSLGGGNSGGNFVVDAYPVSVHAWDIVIVFVTVLVVGFLSVWYPVRYLSRRLLGR